MPESLSSVFRISGTQTLAILKGPPGPDEAHLLVVPFEQGVDAPQFTVVLRVNKTSPDMTYEAFVLRGPNPQPPPGEHDHGTPIVDAGEQQTVRELVFEETRTDPTGVAARILIERLVNQYLSDSQG